MEFDHAGIATNDVEELSELFTELFDVPVAHRERFDGMEIAFLDLGDGYFELLEPTEGGPIERHLEQHGPGIHHLAVGTDDIEHALDRVQEAGIRCIDDAPREGAWGHQVLFLHPRDTGGVLIELVQH